MSRKRQTITLALSDADHSSLEAIALEAGCTWGTRASVSEMVRKIARGDLALIEQQQQAQTLAHVLDAVSAIESKVDALKAILTPVAQTQESPNTAELLERLIATLCEIPADPASWNGTTKANIRYGVQDALKLALKIQESLGLFPK